MYLSERQSYRGAGNGNSKAFNLLADSPNDSNDQGGPGWNQEPRVSSWLPHRWQGPKYWAFCCCLLRFVTKEQGGKWNSQDANWHSWSTRFVAGMSMPGSSKAASLVKTTQKVLFCRQINRKMQALFQRTQVKKDNKWMLMRKHVAILYFLCQMWLTLFYLTLMGDYVRNTSEAKLICHMKNSL